MTLRLAVALILVSVLLSAGIGLFIRGMNNTCRPDGGRECAATVEEQYHIPSGFCIESFTGRVPYAVPCTDKLQPHPIVKDTR